MELVEVRRAEGPDGAHPQPSRDVVVVVVVRRNRARVRVVDDTRRVRGPDSTFANRPERAIRSRRGFPAPGGRSRVSAARDRRGSDEWMGACARYNAEEGGAAGVPAVVAAVPQRDRAHRRDGCTRNASIVIETERRRSVSPGKTGTAAGSVSPSSGWATMTSTTASPTSSRTRGKDLGCSARFRFRPAGASPPGGFATSRPSRVHSVVAGQGSAPRSPAESRIGLGGAEDDLAFGPSAVRPAPSPSSARASRRGSRASAGRDIAAGGEAPAR